MNPNSVHIDGNVYPIVDDVIILLDPGKYPPELRKAVGIDEASDSQSSSEFDETIQYSFGDEWQRFSEIYPIHEVEFEQYFDLIDFSRLKDFRVVDAGCGMGRWSYYLRNKCKELVLLDFSNAIFEARRNLKEANNALFFMADIKALPFREGFADFLFSLGVLHHLPTNALDEVRALKRYAPTLLIYLYYALDNKPVYYRAIIPAVSFLRLLVSKVRSPFLRTAIT